VLLYVLLTGKLPYRLTSRRPDEVADAIRTQPPEPPSTAAIGLADDLDRIVLMAIRKEPERRYASVRMLSDDIGRFLAGLPVMAHGDALGYRASKFVRRHAAAVVAGCFALLCLLAAMAGIAWEARIAHAQKIRAEQRFNDVRKIANSFLFEFHDSIQNIPGTLKARQLIVKRALEYLDSLARDAGDDRALQAELAAAYDKVGPSCAASRTNLRQWLDQLANSAVIFGRRPRAGISSANSDAILPVRELCEKSASAPSAVSASRCPDLM
jgi:non-specific serine/threonine protein kinase/serine/threonine-protein kinase